MAEVKTRYGVLTVPDVKIDVIGRFLQHYGEWAWDEASFVASVIPDNASILDIGAFAGTFGLGLAKHRPLRTACFVEANPILAPLLEENIRRNAPFQSVVRRAIAVGTSRQPMVGRAKSDNLGSTSFAKDAEGDIEFEAPACSLTLTELRGENGPFDLIKIDAEGLEMEIIQADAEFLSTGEATIWIECNETAASVEIAELLLSWGLEVHYFAFPSHNPENLNGTVKTIFPMAYEAGLLVSPKIEPKLTETLLRHNCILEPIRSSEDLRTALWRTPRWGLADWHNRSLPQVVALAGRALRTDSLPDFLEPNWVPGEMLQTKIDRLQAQIEAERRDFEVERQKFTKDSALLESQYEGYALGRQIDPADKLSTTKPEAGNLSIDFVKLEITSKGYAEALAKAATLSLDRLSELGALREERDVLRARVRTLEAELSDPEPVSRTQSDTLAARLRNAAWHSAQKGRQALVSLPPLHRLARFGFRFGRRVVRFTQRNLRR